MRRYQVSLSARALDWLEACRDAKLKGRLGKAIDGLASDPRPPGCKKLKDEERVFRIRVGEYRILYEVHDNRLLVLVIRISKREDAYR